MIKSVCHEESEQLIGHIPIEISQLISYFLEAATTNTMTAVVTGKRKREIGLVVPAKYVAYTEPEACLNFDKKTAGKVTSSGTSCS